MHVLSSRVRARASKRCSDFFDRRMFGRIRFAVPISYKVSCDELMTRMGVYGDNLSSFIVCSNVLIISVSMPSYLPYLSLIPFCV